MDYRPLVLIVDDDPHIRDVIRRFIAPLGFEVAAFGGGAEALASLEASVQPDVALVDLTMPGLDGLEVLRGIRARLPDCRVVLMTGAPTVDSAIEAVKLGALDYLSKPFEFKRLRELLSSVREQIHRREELLAAEDDLARRFEFRGMIGRSPAMQELFDTVARLAPHLRAALVSGETGTGKELVARALHAMGPRASRPFVPYNCSSVVEGLFETEFFGHTRGAFTGAVTAKAGLFDAAQGGTLFLDEIGELAPPLQAKLLRVIEHGEVQRVGATAPHRVDVCVIAATNRLLDEEVRASRFREDLFYRLNVVSIRVPPLRDRVEDIGLLTAAFVKEFAARFRKPIAGVTPGAERLLTQVSWRGNVRQLRNTLERACMLSDAHMLGERDIAAALAGDDAPAPADAAPVAVRRRTAPDRARVSEALQEARGNRSEAARRLGVSRRALYRLLESFELR